MLNILFCYLYRDKRIGTSSGDDIVNGFKALGHNTITCGPDKGNFSEPLLSKHNIPILDKPNHPETYDYDEIINLYRIKYGYLPDLIVQLDSHFYFSGKKPKNIPCVYWIADVHRGPTIFRNMAIAGNFDKIFLTQKYYAPVFERVGLDCSILPWAYDDTCIFEQNTKAECDIVFVGTTGIKQDILKEYFALYGEFDKELDLHYYRMHDLASLPIEKRLMGWENRSLEYAERAELLVRLSQDFDVRVYERCYGTKLAQVLSRGCMGFHHSLRRDITLRLFEVPAVNRLLIADEIPYLEDYMINKKHLVTFRPYYQPIFAGFDLDYEEVKNIACYYLKHSDERCEIAQQGMQHVKKNHTFQCRAKQLLETIFR